mmetsp:Transcript_119160/g.372657  ORF Transcript_119160/g.372657 Transcript_119160/m.372657 type:complete len:202 (+) Transcript_119160:150-755(+)
MHLIPPLSRASSRARPHLPSGRASGGRLLLQPIPGSFLAGELALGFWLVVDEVLHLLEAGLVRQALVLLREVLDADAHHPLHGLEALQRQVRLGGRAAGAGLPHAVLVVVLPQAPLDVLEGRGRRDVGVVLGVLVDAALVDPKHGIVAALAWGSRVATAHVHVLHELHRLLVAWVRAELRDVALALLVQQRLELLEAGALV